MTKAKNTSNTNTTEGLTTDQIEAATEAALEAIGSIFVDEITQSDEVDGKPVELTKNRLWFLSNSMVNGFVWKLEQQMLDAHKKMNEHRAILQSYEDAEKGIVTQRMRDDKAYWLDQHTESFYLTATAFEKAQAMHEAMTGRPYKTASQRAAEQQAKRNVVKARTARISTDAAAELEAKMGLAS